MKNQLKIVTIVIALFLAIILFNLYNWNVL